MIVTDSALTYNRVTAFCGSPEEGPTAITDGPIATSSDGWLRNQFAGQAMLTLDDLNALPIDDRVLELLPEKVARDFDAYRVGEFREDCFELQFTIETSLAFPLVDALTDRFLRMIEQRNLQFGGGGFHDWFGVVQGSYRGTTTEDDRQFVLAWLTTEDDIIAAQAGNEIGTADR